MTRILGRYDVVRELGSGGAGTVFLANDVFDGGRSVALKRFRPDIPFKVVAREFDFLERLYHPSVIAPYACGTLEDGSAYLVSACVDGEDIVRYALRKSHAEKLALVAELALALDFVHARGIVHLDLKPGNVLVAKGGASRLKLLDFGMARLLSKSGKVYVAGTLAYMAPERLKRGKVDGRADLYALGLIAYELFCGRLPFPADDPDAAVRFHLYNSPSFAARARVPDAVIRLIMSCLAKRPGDRFARGLDVAKFIRDEAGLALDLSAYGPLSGAYRRSLVQDAEAFVAGLEERLKKKTGPLAGEFWTEGLGALGRYEQGLRELPVFDDQDKALLDRMRYMRARLLLERGDYLTVLKMLKVAATDRRAPTIDDMNVSGLACFYLGRYDEAERLFAAVLKRRPNLLQRGSARNYLGMSAYARGRHAAADTHYVQAERSFSGLDDPQPLVSLYMNRAALYQQQGEYRKALEAYEKSLKLARAINHRFLVATLLNNLANLYTRFGASTEARAFLAQSKQMASKAEMPFIDAYNLLIEGDIACLEGKTKAARTAFMSAHERFLHLCMAREAAIAKGNLFELAVALGDVESARCYAADADQCLELELMRGSRAALRKKAKGEEGVPLFLARAACAGKHGLRTLESGFIRAAHARLERFREAIPFEYRETMLAHPLWKRVVERKNTIEEEDPVKIANFTRLLEVGKRLNCEHRLDKLFEFIMDAVIEMSGAERGFFILARPEAKRAAAFSIDVARNLDQETVRKPAYKLSRTLVEKVLRDGKAVLATDAAADPRLKEAKSVQALKLKSIVCAPLVYRGKVLGAIYAENRFQSGVFTSDTLDLLSAFADQAAIAVQNARLHTENRDQVHKISQLNEQLKSLVAEQSVKIEETTQALAQKQRSLEQRYRYDAIVGESPGMHKVFELLDRLVDRDISVLVTGESGTGKELVARALHYNGPRRAREFVAINCSAIPAQLLESELFGYVRGAFTGAERDKAGLFETAEEGTLFLDEIGDMPIEMQAKLLRVLQEREIRRLGSHRKIPINVRVVAATHRDLRARVADKTFREDLYYRLNAVEVHLPALRERREDIPRLADFLLKKLSPDHVLTFTPQALDSLMRYDWPGNIRELANEIERAVTLSAGSETRIDIASLSAKLVHPGGRGTPAPGNIREHRDSYERALILRVLDEVKGNKSQAAQRLGISRVGLYQKLKRFEVEL